jgi:hypothetical protein
MIMGVFQDLRHLRGRFRQNHDQWHLPVGCQAVGFIGPHLHRGLDHPFARDDAAKCSGNIGSPANCFFIGYGHFKHEAAA